MSNQHHIVIRTLNGSSHSVDLSPADGSPFSSIWDLRRLPGLHPDLRSCQFFFNGARLADDSRLPALPPGSFLVAMPFQGKPARQSRQVCASIPVSVRECEADGCCGESSQSYRRASGCMHGIRQVKALQRKEAPAASITPPASPAAKPWGAPAPREEGGGGAQVMDSLLVGYSLRPSPLKGARRPTQVRGREGG